MFSVFSGRIQTRLVADLVRFLQAGGLKSFLESGKFSIANVRQTSNAGFIILGNIPLDENNIPIVKNYFEPLPEMFRESAFLDRFHGFI